jgi:hypothetical protein
VLYDAAEASISWTSVLFILPHLGIGTAFLWATWRKKVWLRGMSGMPGLLVQGLGGGLFFGVSVWVIATNTHETLMCKWAAAERGPIAAAGQIVIEQRFNKPGNSRIRFSVSGYSLHTYTLSLSCDCGYLRPVGQTVSITEGRRVQVRALGEKILTMESLE